MRACPICSKKAILSKVLEGKEQITYEELVDEMIADAWYMVIEYHLNLGPRDTLESLVLYLQKISHLVSFSDPIDEIRPLMEVWIL